MSDNVDTSPLGIERTERIAGDAAVNSKLDIVTTELQNTQTSVTTEVMHRSEGDLVVQRILEGYIQDLLDGKADDFERYIEFQNSQNLNYADVRNFVSSIRTSLADEIRNLSTRLMDNLQANDARYNKLVSDVGRYLEILSDITLDSNQITLDNGELRAGAWTILSQARAWDLEIISRLNGLTSSVGDSLKDAVEEIQNQLPSTEATISKAIEELSKSPIIKNLADLLDQSIENDIAYAKEMVEQARKHANDMAQLAGDLRAEAQARAAGVEAFVEGEVTTRIQEINKEVAARKEAINLLTEDMLTRVDQDKADFQADMLAVNSRIKSAEDGLTSEIQHRKDGDTSTLNALNTYKVSNDSAITGLSTNLSNTVTKIAANTTLITGLTSRMDTAELGIESATTAAADAMSKATTAVSANSALSTRVDALAASLTESDGTVVDVNAFNALKAEVNTVKGTVTGLVEDVTALESNYTSVNNKVTSQGSAIETLNTKMTTAEGSISQSANDITLLKTDISSINAGLLTKVDSQAFSQLSSDVSELDGKYTTQSGLVTDLRGSLDTTNLNVSNAANAAQNAFNTAGSKGKVIFGSDQPGVGDRLSQNLWIDTTGGSNTPKRWNGAAWVVVTDKVASDALSAANAASALANTKADSSALSTLDSKVDSVDGKVASNAANITTLQGKVSTVENGLATKADAEALSALTTRVSNTEGGITSQGTRVTNLENSVNHETTGLNSKASSSALTSLDNKVTLVDDKVSVTNSSLLSLEGRVTTAENGIASKLDASVINNYYTKTESDQATATSITTLRAQLATGARNFVRNTKEPAQGQWWMYQRPLTEKLTGVFTISFDVEALDDPPVGYTGGGVGFNRGNGGEGGFNYVWYPNLAMKGHLTHTLTLDSGDFTHFGIYANNYVKITNVMVQRGDVDYPWAAAPEDNEAAIDANAAAIRNTETAIATVDGKVNAQATDLLNLSTGLTNLNNTKLDASIIQQYRTAVDQDSVTSGAITQFKSTLKVGGVNVLLNSKEPRSGVNEYLMYENSAELKDFYDQNLNKDVTVSCEILVPVAGSVLIYASNQSAHWFEFRAEVPANQWTRVVATVKPVPHDTNPNWATSSLEFYGEYGTGRIVTVRKVQLEAGNFATAWSPSPRDYEKAANLTAEAIENVYTKAEADNATSGAITQFSSKLKVGGENLLSGTAMLQYPTKYKGFGVLEATMDASTGSQDFFQAVLSPLNEEEYVLSFDAKSDREGALLVSHFYAPNTTYYSETSQGVVGSNIDGRAEIRLSTEWKRYWVKWKHTPTNGNKHFIGARLYPEGITTIYSIARMQLEVGSIPSEYSDRPIDVLNKLNANATAIENTNTQVSNVAHNLAAESAKVSDLSASLSNLSLGGFNLLYNGDFSLSTSDGWAMGSHLSPITQQDVLSIAGAWLPDWALDAKQSKTLAMHTSGYYAVDGYQYTEVTQVIEVLGDTYYQLSAYCAIHRGNGFIYATFLDEQGAVISYSTLNTEPNAKTGAEASGGRLLKNYKRVYLNTRTPPNATRLIFSFRTLPNDSTYTFITRAMCCQVSSLNAPLMPWNEGSSAAANVASTSLSKVTEVDGRVSSLSQQTLTLSTDVAQNTSKLVVQGNSIDGIKAEYFIKTDVNGLVAGYGLVNSGTASAFAVSAEAFFVGSPNNSKKPFMVLSSTQTINGVSYPAGTWIDTALIANATIGTAHIADASITNAKIGDATIESAKIKSIKADKIEIGNPLVGPITPSMVTGTSLTNAANLFNGDAAANGSYATYGTGTQSDTSGAETNYIQVDVGSTVSMPEVRFFFRGSTGRKTYIKLKASVDGSNWDYIMGSAAKWETIEDMPPGPGSSYGTVTVQASFSWYGVKPYRYLRIYGNGSNISSANELVAIIGNASGTVTKIGSEGILTGAITADKIQVDSLSAVSANLGTLITYKDPANPDGARMVLEGSLIRVYDDNNIMRVRMGLW